MVELNEHLDQLVRRGVAAYDAGRFAAAAELLSAYVRHRPADAFAWFALGDALCAIGLADEAERALQRADELTGDRQPWPRVRLGMLHEQQGHRATAEADYASVADRPAVAAAGWYWVARATNLFAMGDLAAAERCGRAAVACDDADVGEAHLVLGNVLRAAGRYAEASRAFRAAAACGEDRRAAVDAMVSLRGVRAAERLVAAIP